MFVFKYASINIISSISDSIVLISTKLKSCRYQDRLAELSDPFVDQHGKAFVCPDQATAVLHLRK